MSDEREVVDVGEDRGALDTGEEPEVEGHMLDVGEGERGALDTGEGEKGVLDDGSGQIDVGE